MKTILLATGLVLALPVESAAEGCYSTFFEAASNALKSTSYNSTPVFKTHEVINVAGATFLIDGNKPSRTGQALHVIRVESNLGSVAHIKGTFDVNDGKLIDTEFCVVGAVEDAL